MSNKRPKKFIYSVAARLLFGLALLATGAAAMAAPTQVDERVQVPEGGARVTTERDLRPHHAAGGGFNEAWTYTFLLDGGMQAHFSLSRANLGRIMGNVSGAEFAITNFDGRDYRAPKEYPAENLIFSAASQKLQVHPDVFFEGQLPQRHRVRFKAGKEDVSYDVDLTLTDLAPGLTWGDGVFRLGREQVGMFIHIPYARVSGTVTIDGTTKRVSGTAYMDHTFQTELAPKLVQRAFRFVQHGDGAEVGYFLVPASGYERRVVGFGAVREGGQFRLRQPEALQIVSTSRALGVDVARQLAVRFAGGGQTILNRESDQQAFSVLGDLGGLSRSVVRQFLGGEPFVFRGHGTTNLGDRIGYDFLVVK